ncbi:HigA family addiction module antidote protein [Duganella sp. FT50W]|uniref:HigA family addiction module antidote protein n=2 Tax=Duganella lactea TaxID=2692173 RepID=A0A6L8MDI5_9BURK|nr:HigA family addiction module antidote protein [Duganella lactea]
MEMYNPPTPGEFIKWWYFDANKISARQFGEQLDVSPPTVNRLLNGQGRITPAMAERVSRVVGRSVDSWIRLQEMQDRWQERLRSAA